MNQTYSMTLATGTTWSTESEAFVQMSVCWPYTNDEAKTVNTCDLVEVAALQGTPGPTYTYVRYPSVLLQPKFNNTSSLFDQLIAVGTEDCRIAYDGQTESYLNDFKRSCASPATVMNLANSKFTTNMFSFQMSKTMPFTTEEAQKTY